MLTYLLSFMVFTLALFGLSIGLVAGRGGIRGTCGGLNSSDGQGCGACGKAASSDRACPRRRVS